MDGPLRFANNSPTWTWPVLFLGLLLSSVGAQAQAAKPVTPDQLPRSGTFWSLQRTNFPPWPLYPPFLGALNAPVYVLDARPGIFIVDDSQVDYPAIDKHQAAEQALRKLEWEAGLMTDAAYWALEGGGPAMMMSSLMNSYAYDNPVYLTNLLVTSGPLTASFSITGGTNFVPYDIQITTNLLTPPGDWNWLGIGYTSNRYTFNNQPASLAFYRLAKPSKTMTVAWGDDTYGQCDVWTGITNAVQVTGGIEFSLALLNNSTVVGWGYNGANSSALVPTNLVGVGMIASGWQHNVALLTNGTVTAWGDNFWGETNVPAGLTNAIVVSAQGLHSLVLRSNSTVVAWGHDSGYGDASVPAGLTNVTAISAGAWHNLAVSNGCVVAWGYNSSGQCLVPAGLTNVVDVAAGGVHSVALRQNGTVVCWGNNAEGECNVPNGLTNVVAIAAGGNLSPASGYTIALKKDGTVVVWGNSNISAPLGGLNNVIAVGGGPFHALAVRTGSRTPVITLQPTNQYQIAGGNVTFTAKGVGLYGVTYQWKTNGVNRAGATNTTLTLTNVQAAQAGVHTVSVSNEVGSILSPNASLTLVTPPVITSQTPMPTNQIVIYQANLTLSVAASAPGQFNGFPMSYQWKFNGTNIAGANAAFYNFDVGSSGIYSVLVTNAVGSATPAWQLTITYVGSYVDVGTLAYHLSTNAVARTNGISDIYNATKELSGWVYDTYYATNMAHLTNSTWSTNFWLRGVRGLSATSIGFSNGVAAQGSVTMISPRHCIYAKHMHESPGYFTAAFLDTNNVIYWRTNMENVVVVGDISVGILDSDLPVSVGFLPVLPTNYSNYLPTNGWSIVQGIGRNQDVRMFGQPMKFTPPSVSWSANDTAPFGLTTNWNVEIRGGDSSNPEMLLIGNQLVAASHNFQPEWGPNYANYISVINQKLHYLSTNNSAGTDYLLTFFSLTNWPAIQ